MRIKAISVILCLSVLIAQSSTTYAGWQEIKDRITGLANTLQPYKVASNAALAVCVGFVANKFLPLKEIAVAAASLGLAGASVYGYKYWQHNAHLRDIQRTLHLSQNPQLLSPRSIEPGKTLLFSTWRQKDVNKELQWPAAKDIYDNAQKVIKQFSDDVHKGIFPIFDSRGKKLINVSAADIINAIDTEQEQIETCLSAIDDQANIAPLFMKKLSLFENLKTICTLDLPPQEKLFRGAPFLSTEHIGSINAVIAQVKQEIQNNPHHLISMHSYNPTRWTIAPLRMKAVETYSDLFKVYIRLHAIKQVAQQANI